MPRDNHPTANYYRNGGVKMMGGVVDGELPEDEDTLATGEYEIAAQFRAYMAGSRLLQGGDLQMNVRVPFEDKYEALPLTDLRGITFVMVAFRPLRRDEKDGAGTREGDNGGGGYAGGNETNPTEAATDPGLGEGGTQATVLPFPISGDPFALSTDDR